jgi:hypothetical protein
MKKLFIISTLVLSAFCFSVATGPIVQAKELTISQLVELLISVEAIAPDKIAAARAMAINLVQVKVATTSAAYIQVLTPSVAADWKLDSDVAYSITWGSQGVSTVHVALVSGKNTCELNQTPITSNKGDNIFKIKLKGGKCFDLTTGTSTPITDGTYKVKVYGNNSVGEEVSDDSDVNIKIIPVPVPSLKVTYPNGGDNLVRNKEYDFKYTLKNVDDSVDGLIYFWLYDSAGNIVLNSHRLMRDNTYEVDLPFSLPAGAYKIKLKTTTDDQIVIEDMSDNFFWISTGL